MSDATGLGWVRTIQPLTVRAGRSKRDEPLGTILPDQDVYVAAVSGKRGQITSPYVGWISIRTADDEATIVQEPLPESEKQRDVPVTTGWVRALRDLNVRNGREKRSELVGSIAVGTSVFIEDLQGGRAHIRKPLEGWISVVTADQEPTVTQDSSAASAAPQVSAAGASQPSDSSDSSDTDTSTSGSSDSQASPSSDATSSKPTLNPPVPATQGESRHAPEAAKSKPPAQTPESSSRVQESSASSSASSGAGSRTDSNSSRRAISSKRLPQPVPQAVEVPSHGDVSSQGQDGQDDLLPGIGWWWTHLKAIVCEDEKDRRAFIREPLEGWIQVQSPSGKPILAAEPPEAPAHGSSRASGKPGTIRLKRPEKTASMPSHSEDDKGDKRGLLRELLKDVEPVLAKAPVDEFPSNSPAVKPGARVADEQASKIPAVKRVADEPATRKPAAPVAGMPASEKPAVQVADESASKTLAVKREVRVAGEPAPQNPAVKRGMPVAEEPASKNPAAKREVRIANEPASTTPAVKREVRAADEPNPQNPAVTRDTSVADEPASKNPAVKREVQVVDESPLKTPAVKRKVRVADEPDPQNPAVKWDIPVADEPTSKNPAVKLGVASENDMSPDTGRVIPEEAAVSPQSRTSGSSRTSRTSSSDSSTSSRSGEADGTATSSKSSQSSNLQAKAAEMQVLLPPAAPSPVATGSSFRNPEPDSVEQEGAAESHGGDENEVRIHSSDLPTSKVAGPKQVQDETEPQKSEETGLSGAAEHKVETTSMPSSPETTAKSRSLHPETTAKAMSPHAAHPDVLEPSVPSFGERLSPDLQPASVVISSEPSRTKDGDEQASPASPESAGIQPQLLTLSAEGLSKTTSPPILPVVVDGMNTPKAPARKTGMLDWEAAEPLHPHYETAQAVKLPPRSEWWVHEKEASERRVETLEARLRSALAAQDPVVEWNLHRLEDTVTLDSPCDERSRASPTGIPIPHMEQAFHEEEGLEAAATALLRSAADEEWSRPRDAGTSGHMYPTTDDDWAPPLFSPSSRRNESRAAQSSLLDPATEAPSAGPIPSWIYQGVGDGAERFTCYSYQTCKPISRGTGVVCLKGAQQPWEPASAEGPGGAPEATLRAWRFLSPTRALLSDSAVRVTRPDMKGGGGGPGQTSAKVGYAIHPSQLIPHPLPQPSKHSKYMESAGGKEALLPSTARMLHSDLAKLLLVLACEWSTRSPSATSAAPVQVEGLSFQVVGCRL
ncbi:unnamed protein product [Symbiodinium sp. CCMP2456]|nr:unnamed protein product [Symbiodinium sp. CCMP2456]